VSKYLCCRNRVNRKNHHHANFSLTAEEWVASFRRNIFFSPKEHLIFSLAGLRVEWISLMLYCAELSVQLGAGFRLLYVLNVEYRTRNFEQQK